MQALILRAAYDRIADRLATVAPDLQVVIQEPDGPLTLRGMAFDPADLAAVLPDSGDG